MKIVIGLGNPGKEYENTRHNVGFMFAQSLAEQIGVNFTNEQKFKAQIAKGVHNGENIWIVKPQTYMNLSGETVGLIKQFYKINIKDVFIVYDDISLELGKIRFRMKGSSGGHNGIKSIISHVGDEEFDRLKIGIGMQPSFMKSEDFVLQRFSSEQKQLLDETIKKGIEAFFYYLEFGIAKVQNKYN